MTSRNQTEVLVRDIARLRQAELAGAPEGVADVREDLEEMVGPTVGRASAARILGITQTALDRHVERGAIPVVITPSGRREVPLAELVRLILDLTTVTRSSPRSRPLGTALRERRERALSIDPQTVLPPSPLVSDRSTGEIRGLAFHRVVAARLDRQMVVDARRRLRRWRRTGTIDERWASEWEQVLSRPLAEIQRTITTDDARGRDLRQSSPFAGALGHEERQRVLEIVAEGA